MSSYIETLETLQEERNGLVDTLSIRKAEPDDKIILMEKLGAKRVWHLAQQYFPFSDDDLKNHLKMIDQEIDELLLLVSFDELGIAIK